MRAFLSRSISSVNDNKIHGIIAETEFRDYIAGLGYGAHISPGGWIIRSTSPVAFGARTAVLFPETVVPRKSYAPGARLAPVPPRLHTIASVFYHIGVDAYYCQPSIGLRGDPLSLSWQTTRLGGPVAGTSATLTDVMARFGPRKRYNFLRYKSKANAITAALVPTEFSKEHLRVSIQTASIVECSDVDGIFWGQRTTYPIEIKEKTAATDSRLGPYFGIDAGPFAKLAFYASRQRNMSSLFVVREIDSAHSRNLLDWWFITFDRLADSASWVTGSGGKNMIGRSSTVIRIPKAAFSRLDANALKLL